MLPYVALLLAGFNLYAFVTVNCNHRYRVFLGSVSQSRKLSNLKGSLGTPESVVSRSEVKVDMRTPKRAAGV